VKDLGSAQGRREGSRFSSGEKGRITVQLRGEGKDHGSAQGRSKGSQLSLEEK